MSQNSFLSQLGALGQAIWYDNLSRDVLRSGELKSLIDAGVVGLTSNPTIFKKAIADSNDYDQDIRQSTKTHDADALCEDLMIADVGAAADLLRPIYERSNFLDGLASVEVSPLLAHDTAGTVEAGRRIWSRLDRPNIMIKVPATDAGLGAIKTLLSDGINVNITLIFSDKVYRQVVEAYVSALEARAAKNQPIDRIASVASFFVSRVDALCEKRMAELVKSGKVNESQASTFVGKIGVANSKIAYASFKEIFDSARFKALAANGAKVQRPLWASTGTKNPAFSPVMYVEELAGPQTVNTVPPQTLAALMKGLKVSDKLSSDLAGAKSLIDQAVSLGLDFDKALYDLQVEGVELFATSFRELISAVETKAKKVTG